MDNFLVDTVNFLMDNPEVILGLWSLFVTVFLLFLFIAKSSEV